MVLSQILFYFDLSTVKPTPITLGKNPYFDVFAIEIVAVGPYFIRAGGTFYADSLVSAIRFSNSNIMSAEICTASGVLKNHPIAEQMAKS